MKNTWLKRANKAVNLKQFSQSCRPDHVFNYNVKCPHKEQHILRMMVKQPHKDFTIPKELYWLRSLINKCNEYQLVNNIRHSYCYVTVRHGPVQSVTDDEWHTDGYSEVLTHIPEQNYIVTSNHCTEYVELPIKFPKDFDALQHAVHRYIESNVIKCAPEIKTALPDKVYIFDPYVIHRRPPASFGKQRTFVRITFVPIAICDDACTTNPVIGLKMYDRQASTTRCKLQQYKERT